MEESTTYQLLLSRGEARGEAKGEARGRAEEARKLLVLIGQARLGEPDQAIVQRLAAMTPEQLEQLAVRLLQVETWQDLLA